MFGEIGINFVSYDLQTPIDRKHHKFDYVYMFFLTTYWGTRVLNGFVFFFSINLLQLQYWPRD